MAVMDREQRKLKIGVAVGAGYTNVQLPDGFPRDEGDVALLTTEEYERIPDAAFEDPAGAAGPILEDLGPQDFELREEPYTAVNLVLDTLEVTPATPTIAPDGTQQFVATATYENGLVRDVTDLATWESDDEGVATIDENGLATGVADGTATITATYKETPDTATLTVAT